MGFGRGGGLGEGLERDVVQLRAERVWGVWGRVPRDEGETRGGEVEVVAGVRGGRERGVETTAGFERVARGAGPDYVLHFVAVGPRRGAFAEGGVPDRVGDVGGRAFGGVEEEAVGGCGAAECEGDGAFVDAVEFEVRDACGNAAGAVAAVGR